MSQAVGLQDIDGPSGTSLGIVIRIQVDQLRPGPKLRLGAINLDHLEALVRTAGDWPPIVVRSEDHSIVDGYYRFLAAQRLGYVSVDCMVFEGGADAAFLEGLRRNLLHGLQLSLQEREAAARHLVALHPEWSDRRLSEACGLAPGTIGRLRGALQRSPEQIGHLNARQGRDGKRYPIDPAESRARINRALTIEPAASLRSIARATGASPATVRAVRAQLAPFAPGEHRSGDNAELSKTGTAPHGCGVSDFALLSTNEGREFVVWFEQTSIAAEWRDLVNDIPISRLYEVADEARRRAQQWMELASTLEARAGSRELHVHV